MEGETPISDETKALLEARFAQRKPNAGTIDDPYDLRGPACVIIPVDTPLVNAMPRVPYHGEERGEQLAVTIVRTKAKLAEMGGDVKAQPLAECIYALKFAEQAWIARSLSAWARSHDVADDPIWNAAYLADIAPAFIQRLTNLMKCGIVQDYSGVVEDLGNECRFTVSVRLVALIREPSATPAIA